MPHTSQDGCWNAVCDVCGIVRSSSQMVRRWDNLMVCRKHWEPRHPQDFVRGVKDDQTLPWTRPEIDPTFVSAIANRPALASSIVFPQAVRGVIAPTAYTNPTPVYGVIPSIADYVGAQWQMDFSLTPSSTPFPPATIIGSNTGIISPSNIGLGRIQTSWAASRPSTLAAQVTVYSIASTPSPVSDLLILNGNLFGSNSVTFSASYQEIILADNPTAYYPLDDTVSNYYIARDLSPSPSNASSGTGGVTQAQPPLLAKLGNCTRYAGSGSQQIPDAPKFSLSGSMTAEFWISPLNLSSTGSVFGLQADTGLRLDFGSAGARVVYGGVSQLLVPHGMVNGGTYYVVVDVDASGSRVYVNNALIGSGGAAWGGMPSGSRNLAIGAAINNGGSSTLGINAYISNLAFYSGVLSSTARTAHYNAAF